jgi:ketosteroid isomerase-like protein
MRRAGPVFVAVPLLMACACAQAAAPAAAPLLQLEQTWLRAAQSRDIQALKQILSDDYVDINYAGILRGKSDALRAPNVTSRKTTQTLSQQKVRMYGSTAVVTGLGTLVAGSHRYQWRFTDVFIADRGTWRAVSSQETPVQTPSGG